ncbi:MAG: hypothetical protein Q9191_003432 [Dirinaria sp. TL-2023a]
MSFLFGKKKGQQPPGPGTAAARDGPHSAGGPSLTPMPNGPRAKSGASSAVQTSTPGSSVNTSINSINGAKTPSPEHGSRAAVGSTGVSGDREGDRERGEEREGQYGPPRPALNGPPPVQNPAALYPWSQRRLTFTSSQPNPFPRYGAAVNAVASKEGDVYLMGGLVNGTTVKGDLWMIEAGGGNLACYPVGTTFEGPGPRVGHASLLVGNAFIVFGGDTKMDDRDDLDDTLYLLNTSTRYWSRSMPPGPKPTGRYGHTLNILGSRIYIFGGQVEGYFFNDLIAFDLNALQSSNSRWEFLISNSNEGGPPEGQIPPARTNHTIVSWNDKLYLFGGTNGTQWFNDVWSFDPRQMAWAQLDCIGYIPAPREGHSAALVGDVMYIFGGRTEEGTDLGDLAAFRITSRRWYTFQNMGPSPSPRSGHSMTAYGKQIVVMAGEPSSAPRDPPELSLVYLLDTAKIRYPNDQQIQQTPSGERVPGNRRPSAERTGPPQARGPMAREVPAANVDGLRKFSGSRESMANREGPPAFSGRSQDLNGPPPQGTLPQGPSGSSVQSLPQGLVQGPPQGPPQGPLQGPGARFPRASAAQNPPGPPPQQQPPQPRPNGVIPQASTATGPRSRTPTRDNRPYGPPIDTDRGNNYDKENVSPISPETSRNIMPQNRAMSPVVNGRRTPQQQAPKFSGTVAEMEDPQRSMNEAVRSRSRQAANQDSYEDLRSFPQPSSHQPRAVSPYDDRTDETPPSKTPQPQEPTEEELRQQQQLEELASQQEALISELENARNRNAWYASELALAKKAGYQHSNSQMPTLDEKTAQSFDDEDQPLIEALIAMRSQLSELQGSLDSKVDAAAEQVAAVEQQRDVAIREAAYARAKLAAHGGSTAGTPQSEGTSRDLESDDRSSDLGRKLAAALAIQNELRAQIQSMTADIQSEKQSRELAESTADAAHKRVAEFEQSYNPGELESLRSQLHEVSKTARDHAAEKSEAHSKAELLEVDKNDLSSRLDEVLQNAQVHHTTFASLHEAVTASTDKTSHLERKLEEERNQRETLDQKLLQIRAEYEERTAELDATTRKLRDAEELADNHANEARTHRQAMLTGLETLSNRSPETRSDPYADERVSTLKQQVETAHELVRQNQVDADSAAEKLRAAEERIAGLEAYQEQTSRESLAARKQLESTARELQMLQGTHNGVLQKLESHQRDHSALNVQHSALKELLEERGSRRDTPDPSRVKELEQQLEDSLRAHHETRSTAETRAQEADQSYREKLEQLEADYQSAVHYVKGTEKMLKRMKDELTKYKKQNEELRRDLDSASRSRSLDPEAAAEWEQERQQLRAEIGEMQTSVKETVSQLDRQLEDVKGELYEAQQQRDHFRQHHAQTQTQLNSVTTQARNELEQLKHENSMLESRAIDAEQKVTRLLDQVGTSVTNYRRQSQNLTNGHPNHAHSRNQSTASTTIGTTRGFNGGQHSANNSTSTSDTFSLGHHMSGVSDADTNNRNSVALDSLANELETLRSHWEGTHRNYRTSTHSDLERTPTGGGGGGGEGGLSEGLASWRRRLDREERERATGASPTGDNSGQRGMGATSAGLRDDSSSSSERGSSPVIGQGMRPMLKSNESEVTGLTRGTPGAFGVDESEEEDEVLDESRTGGKVRNVV